MLQVVDYVTKKEVGPNMSGEMYIKTPHRMIAYADNIPSMVDDEGWLRTGRLKYMGKREKINE